MGANAQTSVPAFTAGQVLTAAQVTGINTGIPVFASSTERDAAFGGTGEKTLAEGQMAYLEDTNATQYYDGSSWAAVGAGGKILQVVSTTKTDTFTTTSGTYVDITGMSVSITPSSATSKVLVMVSLQGMGDPLNENGFVQLVRDSTAICIGDADGSRQRASVVMYDDNGTAIESYTINYLDSPSTTSATTYKLQAIAYGGSTAYVNRSENDGNTAARGRTASTITVMEVSA